MNSFYNDKDSNPIPASKLSLIASLNKLMHHTNNGPMKKIVLAAPTDSFPYQITTNPVQQEVISSLKSYFQVLNGPGPYSKGEIAAVLKYYRDSGFLPNEPEYKDAYVSKCSVLTGGHGREMFHLCLQRSIT